MLGEKRRAGLGHRQREWSGGRRRQELRIYTDARAEEPYPGGRRRAGIVPTDTGRDRYCRI
jgi:hypothetical protein